MKSFGVPLSQAPRIKGRMIPSVLDTLITYLETHALSTEGLFRVSGNALRVKELIAELDSGVEVDLSKYEHTTIAETLKRYFHELPEPIVPPLIDYQVKSLFGGIRRPAEEILPEMKFAVDSLSEINFAVLERLSKLLAGIVTQSEKNKMSLPNIVTCIAPTMRFTPAILTYCIVHHKHFFEANPAAPPEELKLLAEGAPTSIPANSSPSSSIAQRLANLTKHNRKTSVPPSPSPGPSPKVPERDEESIPSRDSLKDRSVNIKEELMAEKLRLQDDLISKERKLLKDEFNKERQLMIEEVMREKDMMKEEIYREKGYLKELYSKEKRVYKDEVRRLRKELDMARTVIQTLKDKIDTFAEVNYELERKLKKQQLKNKAMQLDIEGLRRRIAKNTHLGDNSHGKMSPRDPRDLSNARGGSSTISDSYDQGYSDSDDDSVAKRDDGSEEDMIKRYDDKRSKSRGKRRSMYIKSGSSSNIEEKITTDSAKEKKEKAKELLKKNSNKLAAEVSSHTRDAREAREARRPSLDVDDVL